jgi:metal-responsive CopG/Arc/MetJ family transcriptional regulator
MPKKTRKIIIDIDDELYKKLNQKYRKMGFKSIEQYVYEITRRNVFRKNPEKNNSKIIKASNVLTMKKVLTTKGKPFAV